MTLIRELEKKAKLLRLEGSNSMALLLQNAADRIGELEEDTKQLDKVTEERLLAYLHISHSIPLEYRDKLIAALERNNLEQQAKGIDVFKCEINQLLQCNETKRKQLLHAADLNIEMLRNQAKEMKS